MGKRLLTKAERIRELAERIAREFRPERIVLFGSHAAGAPRPDSDVDLLVILPFRGKGVRKSQEILERVQTDLPVDLVVRTPAQLRQRLAQGDFFLRDIAERGKVLYESPRA